MKALIHTTTCPPWVDTLRCRSWALMPVGSRPFLEYWLEYCAIHGIEEVRLILGDGAEHVEQLAGDGSRWGLRITYGFLKDGVAPHRFLQRRPVWVSAWQRSGTGVDASVSSWPSSAARAISRNSPNSDWNPAIMVAGSGTRPWSVMTPSQTRPA